MSLFDVTDRERIDALRLRISNYEDCDLAWRDARTEAIAAVIRWAAGHPRGRDDWRAAIERMTIARQQREDALRALKILRDAVLEAI